jgi:hypothetical protein
LRFGTHTSGTCSFSVWDEAASVVTNRGNDASLGVTAARRSEATEALGRDLSIIPVSERTDERDLQ